MWDEERRLFGDKIKEPCFTEWQDIMFCTHKASAYVFHADWYNDYSDPHMN